MGTIYAGTTLGVRISAVDESIAAWADFVSDVTVSGTTVAEMDGFGIVTVLIPGAASLTMKDVLKLPHDANLQGLLGGE